MTTEIHDSADMPNEWELSTVTRACRLSYEVIDHLICADIVKFPLIYRFSKTKDDGTQPII